MPSVFQPFASSQDLQQGNLKTVGDFTQTSPQARSRSEEPAPLPFNQRGAYNVDDSQTSPPPDKQEMTKPARSRSEEPAPLPFNQRGAYNVDDSQTSPPPDKQEMTKPARSSSEEPAPLSFNQRGAYNVDDSQTSPPPDKQEMTKPARSRSEEPAPLSFNQRGAYNVDDNRTTQTGQSLHIMSKSFSGSPSLLYQPISEKDSHDPLNPTDRRPLSYQERSQNSPSFSSETSSGGHQAAGFDLDSRKDLRRKNGEYN